MSQVKLNINDSYSIDSETGIGQINHEDFGINETAQKIVALMAANPEIAAGQIAEKIGISKRQVESSISQTNLNFPVILLPLFYRKIIICANYRRNDFSSRKPK